MQKVVQDMIGTWPFSNKSEQDTWILYKNTHNGAPSCSQPWGKASSALWD